MKKIFMFLLMLMLALNSYAQTNVTKFLGIPVDGSREKMEKQIEKKGFKKVVIGGENFFTGEFNGEKVMVGIRTNKNKVCRIVVMDYDFVDENQIKDRYNELYNQFLKNPKYTLAKGEMIKNKEDISYQMSAKNKTYVSIFSQVGTFEELHNILLNKYTEEQLNNPSKELKKEIDNDMMEIIGNKLVGFSIEKSGELYGIIIYYDNKYNFPNGEDL